MIQEATYDVFQSELAAGLGVLDEDPERFFEAGLAFLDRNQFKKAKRAFQCAHTMRPGEPRYMSYLGLALALAERQVGNAIRLCEMAVRKEFFRPELFLNLGRVHQMRGDKRSALRAYRRGLAVDASHDELRREVRRMGVRKAPVLPFLDRGNTLNRVAGKALHRLGLR